MGREMVNTNVKKREQKFFKIIEDSMKVSDEVRGETKKKKEKQEKIPLSG